MPPRPDRLLASDIDHTSSASIPDTVDAELLSSLNAILASVSLPRITHILDATPNLLIALYEALHQKRIPLVDRTTKSHTSFNSRVKNVKLLIGTIAHEANISAESAARLGEIDPLKVCQKDEVAVRELLWALVRIGILHRIQKNQGLSENVSPRKPLTLHRPVGALNKTSQVFMRDTRVISGENANVLSGLHKSLERRKELAGIQSVVPRASHSQLKAYNWLQDLPSSFSNVSNEPEYDDSTNDLHTLTQTPKQILAQKTVPKASSAVVDNSVRRVSSQSAQPSISAPEISHHPITKSSEIQHKPVLRKPTSRKLSQTLKPSSYPHAVYNVSYDEVPLSSAEISPVSTVYLEQVSARIMEISNRLLPVSKLLDSTANVSEHAGSPKPLRLSPKDRSRTVSGSSRTVRRQEKSSDISLKQQEKGLTLDEQKTDEIIAVAQTSVRSASFHSSALPILVNEAQDHTQDTVEIELPPAPPAHRPASSSIERMNELDETGISTANTDDGPLPRPMVGSLTGQIETYGDDDTVSETERGIQNDYWEETNHPDDYASNEDQTSGQIPDEDGVVEDARQDGDDSQVSEDESDDHTEDIHLCGNLQLGDRKRTVDDSKYLETQDQNCAVGSPPAIISAGNEGSLDTRFNGGQHHLSTLSDHGVVSHIKELPQVDADTEVNVKSQHLESLLIDVTQLDTPALSVPGPFAEENLIDLLSDPIPIELPSNLRAISPAKTWVTVPRDLRSESRNEARNTPPTGSPAKVSSLLLDLLDLSSLMPSNMLQESEDSACGIPLPSSEVSSVGSSIVSSVSLHRGTQTEMPMEEETSNKIIVDECNRATCSLDRIPEANVMIADDQRRQQEAGGSSNGLSSFLVDILPSPTGSESAWMNFSTTQTDVKRFSFAGIFTSTPKKYIIRDPSNAPMGHDDFYEEAEGAVASNAVGNISILDAETELDELSRELSEYHISSQDVSPAHSPSPLRRSILSGRGSSERGTPAKARITPSKRPDTPTQPNSITSPAQNGGSSMWETEEDEQSEKEEEAERPTTKESNRSETFTWGSDTPSVKELRKKRMQAMQSIIQNWDKAGSSQPLDEESEYIPDDGDDDVADDEDDGSYEQCEEEYNTTADSGSQFSPGGCIEDIFDETEPETPAPKSKQPQKASSSLLHLSPPPQFSGSKLFQHEPQSPYTPLRPRRLFSTPAELQVQAKRASRSFVLERSPFSTPMHEVGNKTLPAALTTTTTASLIPPPQLSKSLTMGSNSNSAASNKHRSISLLKGPAPLASAASTRLGTSTPVDPAGNTSLPSMQPLRSAQMSKMKSRASSASMPVQPKGRNISLSDIQPLRTVTTSKLRARETPRAEQGTPSMSMYYTPRERPETEVKRSLAFGGDLLDMDLTYGLM